MSDTTPLVIYVPGLYSCTLKPTGSVKCLRDRWDPPKSILLSLLKGNTGHSGLALPIIWTKDEEGNCVQQKDDIEAGDCLSFVQDKLLNFLDTLNNNGLIDLHKVTWDWRRSFFESENHIRSTIESICDNNIRQSIIITHSTGAMLTWPTISKHPEWFSSWINAAGCLLCGSNTFLDSLTNGWYHSYLKMLSKQVCFTLPILYSYFPVKGEIWGGVGESDIVLPDGSYLSWSDFDIHDITTWEKFKIGIFRWKEREVTIEERNHLQNCLDIGKKVRETFFLRNGKPHDPSFLDKDISAYNHLKIICYGSSSHDVHSAYEINEDDETMDVSKSKRTTKGDGTLFTKNWQTIPGGLQPEIIMAEEGSDHVSLVNDKKLHDILLKLFFADDELKKASAISLLN